MESPPPPATVIECSTEDQVLRFIAGGDPRDLKVIRFYSKVCPACTAALPDFVRFVQEHPSERFAAVEVQNVLVPRALPVVRQIPSVMIYSSCAGCLFTQVGSNLEGVRRFVDSFKK